MFFETSVDVCESQILKKIASPKYQKKLTFASFNVNPILRWQLIQRLQVRTLWEDNLFALLVLSSRRFDGSSLGFRAGNL